MVSCDNITKGKPWDVDAQIERKRGQFFQVALYRNSDLQKALKIKP